MSYYSSSFDVVGDPFGQNQIMAQQEDRISTSREVQPRLRRDIVGESTIGQAEDTVFARVTGLTGVSEFTVEHEEDTVSIGVTGPTEVGQSTADREEDRVFIAVMGPTGVGKSTFINLVSKSELDADDGIESVTTDPTEVPFIFNGRKVTLIDTPGFEDSSGDEFEIVRKLSDYLKDKHEYEQHLHGLIYFHNISAPRLTGPSKTSLAIFKQLCGGENYKNMIIVMTRWPTTFEDKKEESAYLRRERELKTSPAAYKDILDDTRGPDGIDQKCGKAFRYVGRSNQKTADEIIQHIIDNNKPQQLQNAKERVEGGMSVAETAAGRVVDEKLTAKMKELEAKGIRDQERIDALTKRLKKLEEEKEEAERSKMVLNILSPEEPTSSKILETLHNIMAVTVHKPYTMSSVKYQIYAQDPRKWPVKHQYLTVETKLTINGEPERMEEFVKDNVDLTMVGIRNGSTFVVRNSKQVDDKISWLVRNGYRGTFQGRAAGVARHFTRLRNQTTRYKELEKWMKADFERLEAKAKAGDGVSGFAAQLRANATSVTKNYMNGLTGGKVGKDY